MCSTCVETERCCLRERLFFKTGSSIHDSHYEKDGFINLTSLPDLRLPLCHDELNPEEELVVGSPFETDLVQRHETDDVPVVISESSLTSLLRYWREAMDGDLVIAAPRLPVRRFFTAPKTPPAPFPSFAKYATSLPPPPLFDHELIAAPINELSQPFSPVIIPEEEDEILLNLPDLQRLEATEGDIVPVVLDSL